MCKNKDDKLFKSDFSTELRNPAPEEYMQLLQRENYTTLLYKIEKCNQIKDKLLMHLDFYGAKGKSLLSYVKATAPNCGMVANTLERVLAVEYNLDIIKTENNAYEPKSSSKVNNQKTVELIRDNSCWHISIWNQDKNRILHSQIKGLEASEEKTKIQAIIGRYGAQIMQPYNFFKSIQFPKLLGHIKKYAHVFLGHITSKAGCEFQGHIDYGSVPNECLIRMSVGSTHHYIILKGRNNFGYILQGNSVPGLGSFSIDEWLFDPKCKRENLDAHYADLKEFSCNKKERITLFKKLFCLTGQNFLGKDEEEKKLSKEKVEDMLSKQKTIIIKYSIYPLHDMMLIEKQLKTDEVPSKNSPFSNNC